MQEDVADGLSALLVDLPPPFAALRSYGPISARVHRKIESRLLGDLQASCERANRRVKDRWRGTPYEEWLEATNIRQAFRRVEHTLGTPAAMQAWPLYSAAAGRLGVSFSETQPRRRPLAHCIFHCSVQGRRALRRRRQREAAAAQHAGNDVTARPPAVSGYFDPALGGPPLLAPVFSSSVGLPAFVAGSVFGM